MRNSVLGRDVRVHAGALVEDASSWTTATSAAARKLRRAILDKNVRVPPDTEIGYDLEARPRRATTSPKAASWWWGATRSPIGVSSLYV